MMKNKLFQCLIAGLLLVPVVGFSQENKPVLPAGFAPGEEQQMDQYLGQLQNQRTIYTTPPGLPARNAAQWEEVQALVITWTGFPTILSQIVNAAQTQCKVIIHCNDSNTVKSDLISNNVTISPNVKYIEVAYNSIWIRDYGANTVYLNDVDSLILVDWIYNRPRPDDDNIPVAYSNFLNIPLFRTLNSPNNLMNTGGNWMTDGIETAFASELILDENDGSGSYSLNYPNHTPAEIDTIVKKFHGINRYIQMNTLPYDGIHHIDMHMKLLDEKTLLVGEFPQGISDGPQIEANIQYVLSTYTDPWGNPYKIVRIPMPPSTGGNYPGGPFGNASYRTYTNFVIANNVIIMPAYRQQYDTTAYRIVHENMPGYAITMIDADNSNANLIAQSGVIHCITHTVGVNDPLRIVHNNLPDTYDTMNPYQVDAIIQHKSGIAGGTVYWTTDTTQPYQAAAMTLTNPGTDTWTGFIPAQPVGTEIFYYIQATANSGKTIKRPMPAPAAYWNFHVLGITNVNEISNAQEFTPAFPNPSHGITCIPVKLAQPMHGTLRLIDAMGKQVLSIYEGDMPAGEKKYFINSLELASGFYFIELQTEAGRLVQKLAVR